MALKELILRNFQRHKRLKIRFGKYVTSITGPNDSGKSAIIRAIRLLVFNRPSGRSFVRRKASCTTVRARIGVQEISRRVGRNSNSSINEYRINRKLYKAFRSNPPEDVSKRFRIGDVNIQRQHEPVFWFNLSAGAVARELNKLVDLDSIDAVQADIAKQLRDKRAELEVAKSRLAEAESEIERLKWLPRLAVKLDKLHKLHANAVESSKLARIRVLIGAAVVHDTTHRNAANGAANAARVAAIGGTARRLIDRTEKLRAAICRTDSARRLVEMELPKLPEVPKVDEEVLWKLEELIIDHEKKEKELCQVQKLHQKMHEKLGKLLKGKCPVCGRPLK